MIFLVSALLAGDFGQGINALSATLKDRSSLKICANRASAEPNPRLKRRANRGFSAR
jgi:hypothetical protein